MKNITGKVIHFAHDYYVIEAPDAPAHLRMIYLRPSQMLGAHAGDEVELEYQTTHHSGLWNVVAVTTMGVKR